MAAKSALVERNQTITALALKIRRNRSSVSQAINQGRFPRLQEQIARALGL